MTPNLVVPETSQLSISNKYLILIVSSSVIRNDVKLRFYLSSAKKDKINGKKIYEALLQTYLFAGFPSALISLRKFSEYFKIKHNERKYPTLEELRQYGISNCRKIYGDKQEKLVSNVKQFSPDLSEWLILEGYGKVFSRKGLKVKEREICAVAVLTTLTYRDQLYSHINGAVRVGVSIDEIIETINLLSFTTNKKIVKFGNKVVADYIKEKGLSK